MKKIILTLTIIIAIVTTFLAVLEVVDYYNKKNKIDNDKTLTNIYDKVYKLEEEIKEKLKKEDQIKEENKSKFEELEIWKKKRKEVIESI